MWFDIVHSLLAIMFTLKISLLGVSEPFLISEEETENI